MSWTAIVVLALGAYLFKAAGVLILGPLAARSAGAPPRPDARPGAGARETPAADLDGDLAGGGWPLQLGQLLPPALLAALVVNQTVAEGQSLVVDARLAGVAAGALAVWRGAPFWLVLVVAASVTAALRALTG